MQFTVITDKLVFSRVIAQSCMYNTGSIYENNKATSQKGSFYQFGT
jgi:hypothetical protein